MSLCRIDRQVLGIACQGLLTLAVLGAMPAHAQWGTLSGTLHYAAAAPAAPELKIDPAVLAMCIPDGDKKILDETLLVAPDGGVANIVLYVTTKNVKIHPDLAAPPAEKPILDNVRCQFAPHILPVMVGQPIVIRNSDSMPHNVNVQPLADTAASINPLLAAGQSIEHKFNRAQRIPVPVACNIHHWMKGYVLPRDNPYFAVSAPDGTFQIEKLPLNVPLEIQVWHEKCGYVNTPEWPKGKMTITLKDEKTDLGTVKLPAF